MVQHYIEYMVQHYIYIEGTAFLPLPWVQEVFIACGVDVSGPVAGRTHERRIKTLRHPGYFSLDRQR